MFKKRIAEIEARKAEISTEIQEADEARTLELDQEVDSLNAELVSLRSKMSVADKLGDPVPTEGEQRTGSPVNREMRAKQLRETRSVTITSGKLATPTKTGGINDPHPEVSSVVDQVTVEPCEGMGGYKVAYLKNSGEGADATEGEDRSETDPEFDYAEINPGTVSTYTEISRESIKLSDLAYLDKVESAARTALRKKVAGKILGTGEDSKFTSIFKAEACVTDVEISAIDATTLRKIAMSYGGDEAIPGNAVLYLNKKDLIAFGDVRGTNEKKAVYDITPDTNNPNTGIIKDGGLSVKYCIHSKLTPIAEQSGGSYSMAYGNPKAFELALFSDYTVTVDESVARKKGMVAVFGEVMIGGNVTVYDGFVRVKKAGG